MSREVETTPLVWFAKNMSKTVHYISLTGNAENVIDLVTFTL